MAGLLQDVRFALRALRKSPGFTLVCVLTLALGIGANTAIFSALDAALFRPLAYPEADRLATLHLSSPGNRNPGMDLVRWSWPKVRTLESLSRTPFQGAAAFAGGTMTLTGVDVPGTVSIEMVSSSYFSVLGARPALGRAFSPSDDERNVAVVSEGFWNRRFGGAPGAIGSSFGLNGKSFEVLGVLPAGFAGLSGNRSDVWIPVTAAVTPEVASNSSILFLNVVARLKPAVTMEAAAAGTALAGGIVAREHPSPYAGETWTAALVPLERSRVESGLRRSLLVLSGAAACVLLICCVNLASLLLARGASRRKELAIRVALGASRPRLLRHALAESLVVSLAGGSAGLLLARWSLDAISQLSPPSGSAFRGMSFVVDLSRNRVDLRGALIALGLSVLTAVTLGVLPGLRAWRFAILDGLTNAPSGARRRDAGVGGGLVVVAQLAIALVLLSGAGLMAKSLWRLLHVDLGFEPASVVTFPIVTPARARNDNTHFREELVARLSAVAGISSVAVGTCAPVSGNCSNSPAWSPEGPLSQAEPPRIDFEYASRDLFKTLGIAIREGRTFDGGDRSATAKVVIVNEALARLFWPGTTALGKKLEISGQPFRKNEPALVVGVVGDVRYGRLDEAATAHAFVPDAQGGGGMVGSAVFVRSRLRPDELVRSLRTAIHDVDPDLAVDAPETMTARVANASGRTRFAAALLGSFAGLALVISSVGVLGVMAYAVSRRTREIGIRMALGARPTEVFRLLASRGLALTGAGIVAGICGALVLTRVLGSLLFDVSPLDPLVFSAAALLLGCLAALGSVLPARLALRVDPVSILRSE